MICMQTCFFKWTCDELVWVIIFSSWQHYNWSEVLVVYGWIDPAVKHTNMGDVFRYLFNTIYDRTDDVSKNRDRLSIHYYVWWINIFQNFGMFGMGCFRQILKRHLGVSNRCHLSNDFWWTNGVFSPRWDPWMVNLLTWIVVVFFNGEWRYQRYISRGVLLILLGGWFSTSKGH